MQIVDINPEWSRGETRERKTVLFEPFANRLVSVANALSDLMFIVLSP